MMDDTYEKSGGSANSAEGTTAATATLSATTPPVTTTGQSSDLKSKLHCRHTDGAIKVADYILNEIKTNVRGRIANVIRGYIDDETMKNTLK
ncbi:hypothetical protein [Erwinia sp. PsM31]|jgi:hypothetical protein|nr:hypothetical protein [Erwinia sp. PsM31]MDN4629702.1 hypothetical protein [Erwinia sp. PsM31]